MSQRKVASLCKKCLKLFKETEWLYQDPGLQTCYLKKACKAALGNHTQQKPVVCKDSCRSWGWA